MLNKHKYPLLLLLISIGFLISIVRYSLKTYYVPVWDDQYFLQMAVEFFRMLKHPTWSIPYDMLRLMPIKQPGYSLMLVPFLMIFGLSHTFSWALFLNGLLYVLILFGIYYVAQNYISRLSSFLASVIFLGYGYPLYFAHFTYSETATTAVCIWAIFFLIKSNYLQIKKYSLLFGLFLGVGMLIRWVTILFILGPLLFNSYYIIKKRLYKKRTFLINVSSAFIICFLLSFYPYFINKVEIFPYFMSHEKDGSIWNYVHSSDRELLSLYSLVFYIDNFSQLGIFYFLIIFLGIFLSFRKSYKIKNILLAIFIPWLIFSFLIILKGARYILPIYPYLAIVSAVTFDNIKNNKLKYLLIILTVILTALTFLGSVWGKGPMNKSLYSVNLNLPFNKVVSIYLTPISNPPDIYKKTGREIVRFIADENKNINLENTRVLLFFSYKPLDLQIFAYNLYNLEKPLNMTSFLGTGINDLDKDVPSLLRTINSADYILMKTGTRIDYTFPKNNYRALEVLNILTDKYININDYFQTKAKFWVYQDSSTVVLYKRKKNIKEVKVEEIAKRVVEEMKHK